MKAALLHAYGQPFAIEDVTTPEPGPGQVLLRVQGAGFCHSDLHVADGEVPIFAELPAILGHENAGTVEALGPGVDGLSRGQPVAVFGGWGCGRCDYCVGGAEQVCERPEWVGLSSHHGGYAEYLLVPAVRYLVPLDRLEPRVAAPFTDAALTPYRAIRRALPFIQPDHAVLVIGVGGLGQFGIKLLRLLGGASVIAVDTDPAKLDIARDLGARHVVDGRDPDAGARVAALSAGGVSAAFDFVGADATLALALGACRSGGKVTQIGLAPGKGALVRPMSTTRFEVLLEATLWGTVKELREVIALAESGDLTPIDVEFAPLESVNDVHDRLRRGEVRGRAVITP